MLQILIAILLGIFIGIFTGLLPGLHVNLIAVTLISMSALLLEFTTPLILAVFIISLSVTHTFLDIIPSVFLGAPDSETVLGVLPGHRYLLKGSGLTAVKLAVIGSFGALILSTLFFPLFIFVIYFTYPFLSNYIGYILILVVLFMLIKERKKHWAFVVFLMSGILGLIVFNLNIGQGIFPMLSGLFGIPTLIISLKSRNRIPKQNINGKIKLKKRMVLKAILSGQLSGFIIAVLPGLSASIAALIGMQLTKLKDYGFMILIGSINTTNVILSLATLYVIDKARNGTIIALDQLIPKLDLGYILVFLATGLIAGSISVFIALKVGKKFCGLINKIDYKKLAISVIILIFILTVILSGFLGLVVLLVSTAIGLISPIIKIKRIHAMGCLLLPVIFYFL